MKVIIDDEARGDLDRIYTWISRDSPAIAGAVVARILDVVEYLGDLPHLGHPSKAIDTFEWVIKDLPYIIVYELESAHDKLIITGIFHGAQEDRRT